MKYLKKFENLYLFSELKVGDYVLINSFPAAKVADEWINSTYCRTIKLYKYAKIIKIESTGNYKFELSGFYETLEPIKFLVKQNEIIRKLNSQEIDNFESIINALKYNL